MAPAPAPPEDGDGQPEEAAEPAVEAKVRSPWWRWVDRVPLGVVAMAGTALAGVIAIATTFGQGLYVFTGDQAVLAVGVRDALGFHAQLGPYSRFGWNHPGPALSYLLAPVYAASGHNPRAFFLGTFMVNAVAAVAAVAVVRRFAGEWCSRGAAALVCCAVLAAGIPTITYFWNPNVEALPVLLCLVLAAAAVAGSGLCVIALAVVGSYCVQTDVGTGPTVAVLSVLAVVGYAVFWWHDRHARRNAQRDYRRRRQVVALVAGVLGVAVLVVMWVPPLHQQATGHPGNLSQLFDFFSSRTHVTGVRHHSLAAAVDAVAVTTTQLPFGGDTALAVLRGATGGQLALFWSSMAVGVVAVAVGIWRRNLFAAGLALASLAGTGAAVYAATHVAGAIYPYLMTWATYLLLPAWLAAGWLGAQLLAAAWRSRLARGAAAPRHASHDGGGLPLGWVRPVVSTLVALALLVPVGILGYQLVSQSPGAHDDGDPAVAQLAAFARQALGTAPADGSPLIAINSAASWPVAAGVLWQLERDGLHPKVTSQWGFMFGSARVERRTPAVVLGLAATSTLPATTARAGPGIVTVNDPFYGPTTLVVARAKLAF